MMENRFRDVTLHSGLSNLRKLLVSSRCQMASSDSGLTDQAMPATGDVFDLDGRRRPFHVKRYRQSAPSPQVSLIVSTFEKPWHLKQVLRSIADQDLRHEQYEVIVTDDGSSDGTHQLVAEFAESVRFGVALTWHDHSAFQLARCRNEGVAVSRAPYLLFLDGDCVLPTDHVSHHLEHRTANTAMCGYCVRIDKETTSRIGSSISTVEEMASRIPNRLVRAIRKRDRKARFYKWIGHPTKPQMTGGNVGLSRADFERVNGFDENFEGWGGEDTDLGSRLRRAGTQIDSILRWTYTYHLWHPPHFTVPDRIRTGVNFSYLVRDTRLTRCLNGLVTRRECDLRVNHVGRPDQEKQAIDLLQKLPVNLAQGRTACDSGREDVEILFLPGSGEFSGQADCNVLVELQESPRAQRAVGQADILVSDRSFPQVPASRIFRLRDFSKAMSTIAGC